MELAFKIGTQTQTVEVSRERLIGVLEPNEVPVGLTGEAEVRRALSQPIGAPAWGNCPPGGERGHCHQ